MRRILLICAIFFFGNQVLYSQLNAGDIAFIGYITNEDEDDGFTFISLTYIPVGEVIHFTDKGWNASTSSWYLNTEDDLTWTSPAGGIPCGTIIEVIEDDDDDFEVTAGTLVFTGGNWSQSNGDQIIAYQGTGVFPASPTFIAAIHGDYNASDYDPVTTWNAGSSTTNGASSMVPTGLTNGVNCVSLFPAPGPEKDDGHYNGSLTGTSAALRTLINSPANWDTTDDDGVLENSPGDYPVPSVNCASSSINPDIPVVTHTSGTVCNGNNISLTISGNLNSATYWYVYTDSCGGTLVATTATSIINLTPASTTTYYVRGEGGGVTPGSCGTVTATASDFTAPVPDVATLADVTGACSATVTAPTATDNCAGTITGTTTDPLTYSTQGNYAITWTFDDGNGNTSTQTQNVTIQDNTLPTVICQSITVQLDAAGTANIAAPDIDGGSTDACGIASLMASTTSFTCADVGTNTVTLTVTDNNGNTSSCTSIVTVEDTIAPVVICPADQTLALDANCQIVIPDYTSMASITDNCSSLSSITVIQSPDAGTLVSGASSLQTVVITAQDQSGNSASCSFAITLENNTILTLKCPLNQQVSTDNSCTYEIGDYTALVLAELSNCGQNNVTVTQLPESGTLVTAESTNGISTERQTTVTIIVEDMSGNTISCEFIIDVTCTHDLFIPEFFSPNGDGKNDYFEINGLERFPRNNIVILNRWGNKVFAMQDYDNSWNGKSTIVMTTRDGHLPSGTYYYVLDLGNNENSKNGHIELRR
ncbi:MAG: gliding motility-associated C-terminal domain-containing protein [Flavobacteriales bacterium]|nr:gliding motility-associated C-terminal domain-containing protein [Flavobacteriales bacterium]